jgi:hypothetical protein
MNLTDPYSRRGRTAPEKVSHGRARLVAEGDNLPGLPAQLHGF